MTGNTYELTMLYDFFGELLTDKQREYFEYYFSDDLSLSEISELTGVSRQGVRDVLVRAERLLREYEEKTGVVARFMERSAGVRELSRKAARLCELTDGEIRALAEELRRGLDDLKG